MAPTRIPSQLDRIERELEELNVTAKDAALLTTQLRKSTEALAATLVAAQCYVLPSFTRGGNMSPILQQLSDQIKSTQGVLKSADAYVKGVPALITTAVNAALANGATAAELAPLTDLVTALKSDGDQLTADIAANSPPTP